MDSRLVISYVRLSQEDLNKEKDYSESIYNQLALIKSYAKSMGLKIDKEYIDDGYSGMNFDRPGFEELKNDIDSGIIGIIITKDMSRLGRNFIETAYYISDYFPRYNVRYIAINDEFDSDNPSNSEQELMLGFKTLINDRYVKDAHIKRKQIAEDKTNRGEFIGFLAPYGYKIVKVEKRRTLEIDEYSSKIVKRIFTEIASGKSRKEVAEKLNEDKIIPPVIYMKMTPSKNKKYYYDWTDKIVYRILKNQTYLGKIVKRKSTKESHLQKKREVVSIRDRETIDNCHPAIISEQLFNDANSMLTHMKRKEKNDYNGLFKDLVICGECGRIMSSCIRRDRKSHPYYFSCTKTINRKLCPNRTISDTKLKSIVKSSIEDIINSYIDETDITKKATKNIIKLERPNLKIANLNDDIELHSKNIRTLYIQKSKGEITLDQFIERKKNETLLKEQSERLLKETLESKNEDIRKEEILENYKHFIDGDELMNFALRELIENIVIYKDNTIKLSFKFGLGKPKKIRLF